MRLASIAVSSLALIAAGGALAQPSEPKPQYSVEDLQKDFSASPPSPETPQAGEADRPRGRASQTRGFSLPKAPDAAPPARPAGARPAAGAPARAAAPAPPPPGRGRNLLIGFANDSAELTAQARANARVFAQALNSPGLQDARFAIEGHTNAVGGHDYNMELSRRRAQALADFLVSLGVSPQRLDVQGYGPDKLLNAQNPRADENRRVEARRLQ